MSATFTACIQPIREIGLMPVSTRIPFLVDAANRPGYSVDIQADHIDLLAVRDIKRARPARTGFLYIRPGLEKIFRPLREGGTRQRQ